MSRGYYVTASSQQCDSDDNNSNGKSEVNGLEENDEVEQNNMDQVQAESNKNSEEEDVKWCREVKEEYLRNTVDFLKFVAEVPIIDLGFCYNYKWARYTEETCTCFTAKKYRYQETFGL